jgi:hypothetical protein
VAVGSGDFECGVEKSITHLYPAVSWCVMSYQQVKVERVDEREVEALLHAEGLSSSDHWDVVYSSIMSMSIKVYVFTRFAPPLNMPTEGRARRGCSPAERRIPTVLELESPIYLAFIFHCPFNMTPKLLDDLLLPTLRTSDR